MRAITANDLKTKGLKALDEGLKENSSAVISFRGKDKYVVMKMDEYEKLHEAELLMAIAEAKQEQKEGKVVAQSASEHISWIEKQLGDEL